ncbi:MAG TPA: ATP-binding cassette domain-containing protein [Catenuloplanes sp.]
MSLGAHLLVERGGFRLDARLDVPDGQVVALLGPNGAGKSTALRALAGLLPLDGGHIRVGGTVLDDPGAGVFVPPAHRPVGVVFQDYLLFPHLSALENVAFGPRSRGVRRAVARERAAAWLDRVGLAGFGARRPRELSGGQAQRVALARALVGEPRLLLLDEPLAALDVDTRAQVRAGLRQHLGAHDGSSVVVTHDPLDAMVLADRVVVLEAGRVVQDGDPAEITRRPRTAYVARLVGLNLHRGTADGSSVVLAGGPTFTVADPASGPVFVAFSPAAVSVFRTAPDGSPRNTWPARVDGVERHGDNLRVHLDGPVPVAADVTPAAAAALDLMVGAQVWAAVKAAETRAYPR